MPTKEQIVDRQIRRWYLETQQRRAAEEEETEAAAPLPDKPVVAVSRERGSGGTQIAQILAHALDYQLFHREIVDYVAEEARVRREVVESLDERRRSGVELWVEGVLGSKLLHSSDYLKHLLRVVTAISQHGGIVIVGRGAGFIIPRDSGFHLRVVASKQKRVENLIRWKSITPAEAVSSVESYDKHRRDFVKYFFNQDINDPGNYDLIINTDYIDPEEARDTVLAALRAKFRHLSF